MKIVREWLYFQVSAVEGLKVTKQRQPHPLTVEEFQTMREKLPLSHAMIAKGMAYTGMGWTEYTGRWELLRDRIRIYGTKRSGRDRFVPRITALTQWERSYKAFREQLAANGITPYDLRRSYATWLEGAGIPRTRRKLYLGHGATDVTDLYERHEVERFLAEDAEKLRAYLNVKEAPQLRLVKKA